MHQEILLTKLSKRIRSCMVSQQASGSLQGLSLRKVKKSSSGSKAWCNFDFIQPRLNIIFLEKLRELQENLIRSHAAGVGKALTPEKTRMLLALRCVGP